ncbi:hypothetical protein LINPERHAP2_LOCUS43595 [Linum perenne]
MEGISVTAYKKMKHYLRRQGYRRIDGPKIRRAKLGGGGGRRSWRIKIKPKLKFLNKVGSPKKLFIWLRDAYVRMMVGFANSAGGGMVGVGGGAGYGGSAIGDGGGFGRKVVKEYDEKMIIEIYKSLVIAQTRRREGVAGAADESGVAQKLAAIVE